MGAIKGAQAASRLGAAMAMVGVIITAGELYFDKRSRDKREKVRRAVLTKGAVRSGTYDSVPRTASAMSRSSRRMSIPFCRFTLMCPALVQSSSSALKSRNFPAFSDDHMLMAE